MPFSPSITISGIPDKPGISALIFGLMASNNINVDMIVQNISQDGKRANLTFTLPESELNKENSSMTAFHPNNFSFWESLNLKITIMHTAIQRGDVTPAPRRRTP